MSWTEIYEHPLLDDEKNKQRAVHIGTLMSKIYVRRNRDLYTTQTFNQNVEIQPLSNNVSIEDVKGTELEASDRIDKIQEEMKRRTIMSKTIMSYS